MKIQIEITPEEFKELFVPGQAQQQLVELMSTAWQKSLAAATAQFWARGPDLSSLWTSRQE